VIAMGVVDNLGKGAAGCAVSIRSKSEGVMNSMVLRSTIFGTGYSSMSLMKHFPIDTIKM
jgi:hypothetical protein